MITLTITPDLPIEKWRAQCIEHIQPHDQVELVVPTLGFTQLRQYFTVINIVLLERTAQARLAPNADWLKPPVLPPYQRPANITTPTPKLPRQKGL